MISLNVLNFFLNIKWYIIFLGLECSGGKCAKSLNYFRKFEDDISLEESLIYLCVTPFIYFFLLWILENNYIKLLYVRIKNKTFLPKDNFNDIQVQKEKRLIAFEISKIKSKCM